MIMKKGPRSHLVHVGIASASTTIFDLDDEDNFLSNAIYLAAFPHGTVIIHILTYVHGVASFNLMYNVLVIL